jgi:head-tail adaptor
MMRAGDMRHIVRVQRLSGATNAEGEHIPNWVTVVERRASMRRASGTEVFSSDQRQGRVPTEFRLRYTPGILPKMRLALISDSPSRVYEILSAVDVDGRRETLLITAEERVEESV